MEKEVVVIYANEVSGVFTDDFLDEIDMFDIEISKKTLFNFFQDECLEYFRNEDDDEDKLSDEAYFEDWLLEYTADDTMGLWNYAKRINKTPLICGVWKA